MLKKAFIDEMNVLLLKEKDRLEHDLSDIAEKKNGKYQATYEEAGQSDDDNALELTNFANEAELTSNLEKELNDVNTALTAIEKGKYGICKYCNKEIDEKRLLARPTSTSCIACKKALTQEL